MKFKQDAIYKPQVMCPSCGKMSNIDYCKPGGEYTWWCNNDDCGRQYNFKINNDWSVESEPTGTIVTRTDVTLRVRGTNILFVIMGRAYNGEHNDKYFYEEHTCPVNLLNDGIEVYDGDIEDPHGIFEYISTEKLE